MLDKYYFPHYTKVREVQQLVKARQRWDQDVGFPSSLEYCWIKAPWSKEFLSIQIISNIPNNHKSANYFFFHLAHTSELSK